MKRNGGLVSKMTRLLKGGFFHILVGNVLNKAISMVSSIAIVRLVDKAEYAYISYADNIYSYGTLVLGLGLPLALLKFCTKEDENKLNSLYIRYAVSRGGLFQLIVSLVLCISITIIDVPYISARTYMWAMVLYPVLAFLSEVIACYLRTQYLNNQYALSGIIQSVLVCILGITIVIFLGSIGLIIARYIAIVAVVILFGYRIYRELRRNAINSQRLSIEQKRSFLKMGISLMIANLFSSMMPINETFLVNNIIRDEIITANYKVAGLFPQMLLLISGAVTVYFFPIISQMSDWVKIKSKIIRIGLINFFFILGLTLIGMLLTPIAIRILYGTRYEDAIPITYLLWIMRAMNCCVRMVPINMLPAIGKTRFNAVTAALSCVAQTIIDYFLIKFIGVNGAAIGAIIVYFVSGISYWVYLIYICNREICSQKKGLSK